MGVYGILYMVYHTDYIARHLGCQGNSRELSVSNRQVTQVHLIDYDDDLFDVSPLTLQCIDAILSPIETHLQIDQLRSQAEVIDVASRADLILIQSLRPLLTGSVIGKLDRCRGIVRSGLGYDTIDLQAATQKGIPVSNVVGWCDHEVAEHALALILNCVRNLNGAGSSIRRGQWDRRVATTNMRLFGKTLGVVGFGRIGRLLSQKAACLGLNVIACDPFLAHEDFDEYGIQSVDLEELLSESDIISLHIPLNNATHHLINRNALSQVKTGAIIINTSRGDVIEEAALVEAVSCCKLGAVGLDVFWDEPLRADHPLLVYDNVITSPHIASYSREAVDELYKRSALIARDLLTNIWVSTVVNPQVRQLAESRWGSYRDLSDESHPNHAHGS